jgi:metallo-beta-lactamase family protein
VQEALDKFYTVKYGVTHEIDKGIALTFTDAGHILGSAAVHLDIQDFSKHYKITFTGDIGRYNNKILRSPEKFRQADYIICESTYGDMLHEETSLSEPRLLKIVQHTCVDKKGKLIIPAFSVGRTQEIVNMLNNLEFEGKLPRIKAYVDSPLSTDATGIYRKHKECFNDDVKEYMEQDPTPFGFKNLNYIQDVEESKQLNFREEPCIIISASGMADAGRVKHHIANNISNPKNSVLIVGWCSPNSLGRKLLRGDKEVRIFGETHPINAEIMVMNEFSAHGDYNEMLKFLSCQEPSKVKQVFMVHGDDDVLPQWKAKLETAGFSNVVSPQLHDSFDI